MKRSEEQAHLYIDNRQALTGSQRARATYNVNFKELLGSMYNKYDKFLITLNTFASHAADWPNAGGFTNIATVRMVGLNWANSSYGVHTYVNAETSLITNNVNMPGNNAEAIFPGLIVLADNNTSTTTIFSSPSGLCFNRPRDEFTKIEILFRDIRANANGSSIPADHTFQYSLSFSIYGLYD